jgi:hypothetical protein
MTITGGEMKAGHRDRAPKRDLMHTMQVLLQTGRLKIAQALPETAALVWKLLMFQVNITAAAHDLYGTWREGAHDDLVLALALTCWYGEQQYPPGDRGSASRPTIPRAVKSLIRPPTARGVGPLGHGEQGHEANAQHKAYHGAPHDQGSNLPPGQSYHRVFSFPVLTRSQTISVAALRRTHQCRSGLISLAGMDGPKSAPRVIPRQRE